MESMAAEVPNYRTIMEEKKGLEHRVPHTVPILYIALHGRPAHIRAQIEMLGCTYWGWPAIVRG